MLEKFGEITKVLIGRAGRPNGVHYTIIMCHSERALLGAGKLYVEFKESSAVDAALALDGK